MSDSEETIVGAIRMTPEPSRAVFAVETATNFLETARTELERGLYEDAYEDAKNAIRMAVTAMMYNDGYVAKTIESAFEYIEKKHGKPELVREWRRIEINAPSNRGIIEKIVQFFGFKKSEELKEEVIKTLSVAEIFVESATALVLSGVPPTWEITRKTE